MTGRYSAEWLSSVALANASTVLDMVQHNTLFLSVGTGTDAGWHAPCDDFTTARRITDDQLTTVMALLHCHAVELGERFTHTDQDGDPITWDLVTITHTGRDLHANLTKSGSN